MLLACIISFLGGFVLGGLVLHALTRASLHVISMEIVGPEKTAEIFGRPFVENT